MRRIFILALFFALSAGWAWAKGPTRIIEGTVSKVSDGDTVQVQDALGTRVKVRLYGIDAPETEKRNRKTGRVSKPGQPYGEEAFQALKGKIGGQRVTVEVRDIDRYRRAVSVVRLGRRDINQEMVREGVAWAYRQYLERPYASNYIQTEEEARRQRRGLWRQENPQPPWEFRRMQKKDGIR
ncbi:thermonuclease family protein [Geomonas agri]|uniref:thermonuclease family protein n=1 Tax=Geomonas agri TaxID=2873702 RepID=UPI001CD76EA4|nr:thermonuclease family protein [Geomonas agri]